MLTSLVVMLLLVYAGISAGLFFLQRSIIYQPDTVLEAPDYYSLEGFKALTLTSEDGFSLAVWHFPAAPSMPTVLYFHGNKGNMANRSDNFTALAARGFGVLALSYRGYGSSGGTPTEQGLYQDARTLIAYAKGPLSLQNNQLILFGESLGSGVAVQMATEVPVGLLVLESPYTSMVRRGQALYPYVPISILLRDKFDSLGKIKNIHSPLILFHGDKDTVVPVQDGHDLIDAAPEPKKGLFYPEYGHVNFPAPLLADEVYRFAREQGVIPKEP